MSHRTSFLITLITAVVVTAAVALPLHAQNRDRNRDRSPFGQGPRSQNNSGSRSNGNTGGGGSNTPTGPATQPSLDYRERYTVLSERNIFLRERHRPSSDSRPSGPRTEPRKPEQTYSLTGIVEEEGEFRAYFENLANPSFTRVSLGEPIARGKITAIALDAVEYEQEGQRRWIEIGHDLTGALTVTAPTYTSAGSSTSPTTGQAESLDFDPNDPNLTTLQRMKLRAMQQRGLIKETTQPAPK
jgi:hypothetical protein